MEGVATCKRATAAPSCSQQQPYRLDRTRPARTPSLLGLTRLAACSRRLRPLRLLRPRRPPQNVAVIPPSTRRPITAPP